MRAKNAVIKAAVVTGTPITNTPITKTPPTPPSLSTIFAESVSPETERLGREGRGLSDEAQELVGQIYKAWHLAEKRHREGRPADALAAIAVWIDLIRQQRELEARENDLATARLREQLRVLRGQWERAEGEKP